MSTAALPQLQVLLDNAHSFPAPTPPNSASTNPSESPDSAGAGTTPRRAVNLSSSPLISETLPNSNPTADQKPEAPTEAGAGTKPPSPSPNPLDLIKPPPTPRPWLWQCHRCYTEYKVACTRRCFECGHEFCTTMNNSSKKGPCRSQFDFAGWEAWGSFRRTLAQLRRSGVLDLKLGTGNAAGGAGNDKPGNPHHKRRKKSETENKAPGNTSTFATWTPATETIHDLRRGWVDSIVHTEGKTMPWQAVTAEERDAFMKKKEKMFVRREYNCWLHCDAPSECRLAVYTACFEGRARLVGNGKLTAVLLEDVNPKTKKGKKRMKKEKKKNTASSKLASTSQMEDTEDEKENESEEYVEDKECVIMKKLRRKKNQLLCGSSERTTERRPSTEITTEHVEDRQAEDALPANSILNAETETEERTTSIPRQVAWPSSEAVHEDGTSVTGSVKPTGLLATLVSGSDAETDLGTLPFEKDHGEEDPDDVEFAELVRVSSNLAQSTGNITSSRRSSSSSSATALVSPPPTSFTVIRIDEADHHMPSAEPAREPGHQQHTNSEAGRSSAIISPPPIHQPPQQTKGFVDLKEVINIGYLQERPKSKKRQRSDHSASQTNPTPPTFSDYNPDEIFCPSPIKFNMPIWKDKETNVEDDDDVSGQIEIIVSEYSAADLMDILSSESESCNISSNVSSPESSPASSADEGKLGLATTMRDTINTAFESSRRPISPDVSPSSAIFQEYGPSMSSFSPTSPLSPESKMNGDLSMYLDDEVMSPVSIAAARTLSGLHLAAQGSEHSLDYPQKTDYGNGDDNSNIDLDADEKSSRGNSLTSKGKYKDQEKDNGQCEVLLTLRRMQTAFMGGRQDGRHW